jgi:hypothetical protein
LLVQDLDSGGLAVGDYIGAACLGGWAKIMGYKLLRVARFGLLAGVAAIGVQSSARAATATLTDNYYGGQNTYNNADVIGTSDFDIASATVGLTTTNLTVTINTNYAGQSGLDGTTYGSLFIGNSSTWTGLHPAVNAPWPTDQYTAGEWTYAIVASGTGNGSSDGLYAVGSGTETPNNFPGYNVPVSYTTSNGGTVVMSNVGGDPISANNVGNPGWYFRQGQAVVFNPSPGPALYSGLMNVANGASITYSLNIDAALYNSLKNGFALSWAMTCANDVIQGIVDFPRVNGGLSPTPLPAALPLFAAGLGFLGFVGSRRRKSAAKATVAA